MSRPEVVPAAPAPTTEIPTKYVLEAHKQVTRGRHQFIMRLANQNWKREEINAVVMMIDWASEQQWIAEDLEKADKAPKPPVNVPIPPPGPMDMMHKPPAEGTDAVHAPAS